MGRRGKNRNEKQDTEGVWKDRLRSQMQQPPEFPQIVQQHPAGPQVLQQRPAAPQAMQQPRPAGPLNVLQQPTGPQAMQQLCPAGPQAIQLQCQTCPQAMQQPHPAGPQVMQQRPAGPQVMQQRPAGPQAMQQQRPAGPQAMQQQRPAGPSYTPEEVIELQRIHRNNPMLLFTLLLRKPAPSQQAIEPREMAQRPVAPQQCPTVSQTQQSRAVAPAAIRTQSTAKQASRLGGALRPPSRKTAGGEETLSHPILLSANHFDETMQLQRPAGPQNMQQQSPAGPQAMQQQRPAGPQAMELQHPTGPQEINLSTNYFAVTTTARHVYHVYHVYVEPQPPSTIYNRMVSQFIEGDARFHQLFPVFDHDGKIFTCDPIPCGESLSQGIEFENFEFKINLIKSGETGFGWKGNIPEAIEVLDCALKYGASKKTSNVMLARENCLFSKPADGRCGDIGGGIEMWSGWFQSLFLGRTKFLNVDATQRAFLKSGKVHEIMADMYRTRIGDRLDDRDYGDFSKKIATLKVSYNRGQYIATVGCNGIKGPANVEKFECDGKMVSVQEYFEVKLKMKLQYSHLPCVWVESREKVNLVPMELCSIAEGQEYRRKLSDFQTSAMIKAAATPADVHKQKILDIVRGLQFDRDSYAKHFGSFVDTQMTIIQGRVLPAPKLVYGDGEYYMVPRDGVRNMSNMKLIEAKAMNSFGVINVTRCGEREIGVFMSSLTEVGREMGMAIEKAQFIRSCDPLDLEKAMVMAKKENTEIIFVIINREGNISDDNVKRVGDLKLKIPIVCITKNEVMEKDQQSLANICLKLNTKLAGINYRISLESWPKILSTNDYLIMGAHLTPLNELQPEDGQIAVVVGSVDPRASQYCCEIRIQKSKQEYVEEMKMMVLNLLRKFKEARGASSTQLKRIIFYRDCSEDPSELDIILEKESSAIRKAFKQLNGYTPQITYITVQKRHHTRLFPEDKRDECGRGKNVPTGTTVDKRIVCTTSKDFFLMSQASQLIEGTSVPTYYRVQRDTNKFLLHDIELITYALCHLCTECATVSSPAPCHYADLLAFRVRQYYKSLMKDRPAVTSNALQAHVDSTRELSFMFFV